MGLKRHFIINECGDLLAYNSRGISSSRAACFL